MTTPGPLGRLGERTNTSPANNVSWVVAIAILPVVIPVSDKVAANEVFFAAHGVSPIAWVVLLLAVVVLVWLLVTGVLALVHRYASARAYDVIVSGLMLMVTWFFVANVLARTLLSDIPVLALAAGFVVAVVVTLVARRFAMGTILMVFAAAAAALPLVVSVVARDDAPPSEFDFTAGGDRPSVMWVLSDELQYPLMFEQDGSVRPEFPNLSALASEATTYTKAYSVANYTDYAVPSMLSGITDVAAQGFDRMQGVRAGIGIVPALAAEYSIVMDSPIYSFDCDAEDCASVGSGADVSIVERYWGFAKDTAAIAGRTALAAPVSDLFPSLDGKWRDFWDGGDEFGEDAEGDSVGAVIDGIAQARRAAPDAPVFAFWHTIRTHAPWVVDRQGRSMYPARVPIVDDAHMVGAEADQTYSTDELKRLERRLYASSAVDFDRQLGELVASLKESGHYDDTMIVVTSDHGATMTDRADRRFGDSLVQRWSEVAHVPLVVKGPGQTTPDVASEPRSTGQIATSVAAAAGATPVDGVELSPGLDQQLASGPVFTTIEGEVLTPWEYAGVAEVDPWLPEDLTPPDPDHPFAVGADPGVLGGPVPAAWPEVEADRVTTLSGESDLQLVVVERPSTACPAGASVGYVSADGVVVCTVLWESPAGAAGDATRGWAIVPRAQDYRYWCPVGS